MCELSISLPICFHPPITGVYLLLSVCPDLFQWRIFLVLSQIYLWFESPAKIWFFRSSLSFAMKVAQCDILMTFLSIRSRFQCWKRHWITRCCTRCAHLLITGVFSILRPYLSTWIIFVDLSYLSFFLNVRLWCECSISLSLFLCSLGRVDICIYACIYIVLHHQSWGPQTDRSRHETWNWSVRLTSSGLSDNIQWTSTSSNRVHSV